MVVLKFLTKIWNYNNNKSAEIFAIPAKFKFQLSAEIINALDEIDDNKCWMTDNKIAMCLKFIFLSS